MKSRHYHLKDQLSQHLVTKFSGDSVYVYDPPRVTDIEYSDIFCVVLPCSIDMASVLVVGDSITKYIQEHLPSNAVSLSFPGYRIEEVFAEVKDLLPDFQVVIYHVRNNNLAPYGFRFGKSYNRFVCLF